MTRQRIRLARAGGAVVAFVPTMGALHAGHGALIDTARAKADFVVVSVFVNPDQFGEGEDFERYPRPFSRDAETCESLGVDLLFHPEEAMIAAPGRTVSLAESSLSRGLCGAFRPGHFAGVLSIVSTLFNIVEPDFAIFGQKDAQQVRLIQALVSDLCYGIEIVVQPIVREPDGLAMSSRNVYLSDNERQQALFLLQSLEHVRGRFDAGERDTAVLRQELLNGLPSASGISLDYAEIVDYATLEAVETISTKTLAAVAVRIGATRLIDNVLLDAD
ncbi:MAG: pantoate--beta-alanine ligase [Candidatus Promineifilaceae bacterium]